MIGNAVRVMRIATGEEADDVQDDGKCAAAKELGLQKADGMKRLIGFIGILAIMFGWGYISLTWAGPKPAVAYVYVPAVVCLIVGAALWELWRKNSN